MANAIKRDNGGKLQAPCIAMSNEDIAPHGINGAKSAPF
jgi:hypothetical protein